MRRWRYALCPICNAGETSTEYVRITDTGNVGIGTTSPTQTLHIAGNMRLIGLLYDVNNEAGNNGQILSKTTTGVDWVDIGTIGISGTGTTNYIPRWASASSLTNSSIYDDGTNVGIGTTSPQSSLSVGGDGNGIYVIYALEMRI
jgi:hypothetical protein